MNGINQLKLKSSIGFQLDGRYDNKKESIIETNKPKQSPHRRIIKEQKKHRMQKTQSNWNMIE